MGCLEDHLKGEHRPCCSNDLSDLSSSAIGVEEALKQGPCCNDQAFYIVSLSGAGCKRYACMRAEEIVCIGQIVKESCRSWLMMIF